MDLERARFNMVEQQIRPWEVLDPAVLDLLFHVKREEFVAANQRTLAFTDVELPLPNGTLMLEPKQEARLVQELALQPEDNVLEIGTGSGYVTALMSQLAGQVYSVECDPAMLACAADNLQRAGCDKNVHLVNGNGLEGLAQHAPFDAIFVGGSVARIPDTLKQQLAIGGRMVITVGDAPVMKVLRVVRRGQTAFSEDTLYETVWPRLAGAEAVEPSRFSF